MSRVSWLSIVFLLISGLIQYRSALTHQKGHNGTTVDASMGSMDNDSIKMKPTIKPNDSTEPVSQNAQSNALVPLMKNKSRVMHQRNENAQSMTGRSSESAERETTRAPLSPTMTTVLFSPTMETYVERQMTDEKESKSSDAPHSQVQDASYLYPDFNHDHHHHHHHHHVYHDEDSPEDVYPSHDESYPYPHTHYEVASPVVVLHPLPPEPEYIFVKEKHHHHY